jgi:hypothetical protein
MEAKESKMDEQEVSHYLSSDTKKYVNCVVEHCTSTIGGIAKMTTRFLNFLLFCSLSSHFLGYDWKAGLFVASSIVMLATIINALEETKGEVTK